MITPQHVVNLVLDEATKLGGANETMVLVTDKVEATLRWAGNSMTTNGVSVSRAPTGARMRIRRITCRSSGWPTCRCSPRTRTSAPPT